MRHRKKGRKFKRSKKQEIAMFRSLSSSLIEKEKITTTEAKAKELRGFTEKAITRAKEDNLPNRRLLLKNFSNQIVEKLFKELGSRYKDRKGGYTRIIKTSMRKVRDASALVILEFVKDSKTINKE